MAALTKNDNLKNSNKIISKRGAIFLALGLLCFVLCAAAVSYYWRVVYEPHFFTTSSLTLGAAAVAAVIYILFAAVCLIFKTKEYTKTALLIFLAGLVFVFAGGPMQVPDEISHFLRSYSISFGNFNFVENRTYTGDVAALVSAFPSAYMNGYKSSIAECFVRYAELLPQGAQMTVGEPLNFQIIPYLPQALFIFAARLLGFGALGQMYAARIGGLVLYTIICTFALKNCNRYRSIMLCTMLLPIGLYIAASPSYDGLVLSAAYLFFSFFCKERVTLRDLPVILLAYSACAIKLPQCIIVVVILLIPKEHWFMQTKKGKRISPYVVVLLCAATLAAVYLLMSAYTAAVTVGYENISRWNEDVSIPGQINFIFKNFPAFLARLVFTLYENNFYLTGLGQFGYLDINITVVSLLSMFSLFSGIALGVQTNNADRKTTAAGLVLYGVCFVGITLTAMYVTWTPVSMIRVIGVQARYFLPAVPAFMAAGSWGVGKAVIPRPESEGRIKAAALWVPLSVAVISGILLFQHSYIGPFAKAAATVFG